MLTVVDFSDDSLCDVFFETFNIKLLKNKVANQIWLSSHKFISGIFFF